MPHAEDFGTDDDDTAFIAAVTQVEASQNVAAFEPSPRPAKRRRRKGPRQLDGASDDEVEWSETDDEAHSPPKQSTHFQTAREVAQDGEDGEPEPETDSEYYFPGELGDQDPAAKKSRHKIHVPKNGGQLPKMIYTQTQNGLDLSPSRLRGPVWKRPKPPPPPAFHNMGNYSGRTFGNGGSSLQQANGLPKSNQLGFQPNIIDQDARLALRLQAEEDAMSISRAAHSEPKSPSANKPSVDISFELADLPSDAFCSSSPEKPSNGEIIEISSQPAVSQMQSRGLRGPQIGLKQMTIFGQPATQGISASQAAKKKHAWPLKSREEPPTHHQLDDKAMETWVYPTNLGTIRDYQYNIVSRSLFHNTLVALPTGLGKTFIAATVMLNYYRWTKKAQIVFMAPTKPLIAQQMDACYHIVGIPRQDTVLMTGETAPSVRTDEWLEKRVFFMTPQTVINDLKTGICDPKKIVLLVVDEAHKATGGYAYTEVVAFMRRFNSSFRVMALTATPGSNVEAVQAVIDNLDIARVELRTEQSLDIRQYTHEKQTDTELFDFSDEQALIMDLVSKALRPVLEKLCSQNAYWSRDPMQLTAFGLTNARQKWAKSDAGRKAPNPVKGMVQAIFTVLAQLAHSIGLLKNHGIGPFYSGVNEFQRNVEGGQSKSKNAQAIVQSEHWTKMAGTIRTWTNNPDFIGHPKLAYLREVVLNHFLDAGEGRQGRDVPPAATRVMVFASYRDSTEEICRVLKRNEPMIRPHVFVGQAGSKGSDGMNQKRQNEVVQAFKSGKYNTLIATSIGEEGLDIGDVNLIVCYDASASPIRMLQRIGRTGRKRSGQVVLLLMKGKEENDYAKAQDNYAYIQKSIADASKYTYHDENSPRILPKEVQPVVDKRVIDIPIQNSQPVDLNEKGRRGKGKAKAKRPAKKFHMPDNVRTGFVKASKLDSDEDDDSDGMITKKKTPARTKSAPAQAKEANLPEPEPVQLPYLEDVLLTSVQQDELERKYARTTDDTAELVVRAPAVDRFPKTLRDPGGTKYITHGRATGVVARAVQGMHDVNDVKIKRLKDVYQEGDLELVGEAGHRLVSPGFDSSGPDEYLPFDPVPVPKPRKPRGRPRKTQTVERTTSINTVATNESIPVAPRRTKRRIRKRVISRGSAAVEGDESSPEPTPADMRIGTQGIDLGSKDTSGEEDDEELDSELDAFVARSDEVIETVSSSLPPSQERSSQATMRSKPKDRGLRRKACSKSARDAVIVSDGEGGSDADKQWGLSIESEEERPVDVARNLNAAKRRKIIVDSDSD